MRLRAAAAGKMLLLSPATAALWGNKVRDGVPLEPLPSVPRKGSGKPEPFVSFFVELIEQDPDITLVELRAALLAAHDMRCSTSGIDGLLRRHGYTYKNGLIARERSKPAVRKARHDRSRRQKAMRRQPRRLIFLDETGTDTGMTREYGRSPGGERLKGSAPFRRWGNRTLIAGLSCDGIVAPRVISGALDRDAFDSCIEKVPIPELEPGSVVILDNLATHNSDTATRMLTRPMGATSCSCLPAVLISTLSKWPSRNSRRTSGASGPGPSISSSRPSAKSAISSRRRMPELLPCRWICLMNKWTRFKAFPLMGESIVGSRS